MKFAHRILISTIKKGEICVILHDDISVLRSIFNSKIQNQAIISKLIRFVCLSNNRSAFFNEMYATYFDLLKLNCFMKLLEANEFLFPDNGDRVACGLWPQR